MKNATGTPNLAQENQAIKRQKLEGGRSREVTFTSVICVEVQILLFCIHSLNWFSLCPLEVQILNPKPQTLPHKSKLGNTGMHSSTAIKTQKEDRKVCAFHHSLTIPCCSAIYELSK